MANPPITIGPFTNVPAPGSPIRSDWPQSISNFVNTLPAGVLNRANKLSDEGGFGFTEFAVSGLGLTTPATTGRVYTVQFSLRVVQTTAPPAGTSILFVQLRQGIGAAGAVAATMQFPFNALANGNGWDLAGLLYPTGLTPSTQYSVTLGGDGTGRVTVKSGSWSALIDVT